MSEVNYTEACMIQQAREEYFAGKISADEYLGRVLAGVEYDRSLSEQVARLFDRAFASGGSK